MNAAAHEILLDCPDLTAHPTGTTLLFSLEVAMQRLIYLALPLLLCGSFRLADKPPAKGPTHTILVYEMDWRNVVEKDRPGALKTVIEGLRRRIDPDGAYKDIVRPTGKDRVEIILPTGTRDKCFSPAEVRQIKDLVSRVGHLEFRILANEKDDLMAIKDAAKQIERLGPERLAEYARKGIPPPGPVDDPLADQSKQKQTRYKLNLARGQTS